MSSKDPKKDGRKPWKRRRLVLIGIASVLVAAGVLLAKPGCSIIREMTSPAPEVEPEGMCEFGVFRRVGGVGVLTLWGKPYERGHAHGELLAEAVLDLVDVLCGSNLLLSDTDDYEKKILPLQERFALDPEDEAELRGILDGVKKRLGEKAVLKRIGRPLTLADLKAYNTAGDWYRQACASFAAWGSVAKGAHVWVGRNFDFMPAKAFFSHQMIVVHRPREGRKGWASVSAPGLIGCITGFNEEGVFVSVHDAFLPIRPLEKGYYPRLLVLRRLMEVCEARDLEAQVLPVLEARLQMFDNAVMVASPVSDGTVSALVFEYTGDRTKDKGVTVRRPGDNEKGLSREMITCTNHFRKRVEPSFNMLHYRYPLMRRVLMAKTGRAEKVDFDIARKTMGSVRLPITVHTAVADLNTLELWFASGEFLSPPGNRDYVKLPLAEWLRGEEAGER